MSSILGKTVNLRIVKEVEFGLYLDGGDFEEILLPARYAPLNYRIGDWVEVFVYLDSEDRLIATTETPFAEIGECAHLEVVDVGPYGAFMHWGLAKDLLVPVQEQRVRMEVGKFYTVFIFEDQSGRISASSKLDHFLSERAEGVYEDGQAVDLHITSRSPLGYKAIINGTHLGLIHNNDVLGPLHAGQKITGYIKKIRPDDAIDLALQPPAGEMRDSLPQMILDDLKHSGGVSNLTDRSPADAIFARYQVSKGNYKKALGQLYKEQKIILGKDRITLK